MVGARRCRAGDRGLLFAWRMSQEKVHSVAHGRAEAARNWQNRSVSKRSEPICRRLRPSVRRRRLRKRPRLKHREQQHDAALRAIESAANQPGNRWPERVDVDRRRRESSRDCERDNGGGAKLVVPISDKTPESLARSLARLERMVEQVSAVADQLSDAGTLIGKGMIALNESIDSRRQPVVQPIAQSMRRPRRQFPPCRRSRPNVVKES